LAKPPARPLDSERWAGCVDAVGGATLCTVLTQMKYRGAIAACGLAGGAELQTTVIPFLLRGVNLLGIDSVMCPMPLRQNAWRRLARDLPLDRLETMIVDISLEQLPDYGRKILAGQTRGRVVVAL
jgi:acrylyl-CoA reductase (NADPH)